MWCFMKELKIALRPVTMADCQNIYNWRNHKEVRKASINHDEISYTEHQTWLEKTLNRNDIYFLIAELAANDPLGTLRFDIRGTLAEISLYLTPDYIGKGCGVALLAKGEEWLRTNHPEISIIEAKILTTNQRSQRLFANAGFGEYLSVFRKEISNERI